MKNATSVLLSLLVTIGAYAQDPTLPPTNLGMANLYDGIVPGSGFIYQGFIQYFEPHKLYNDGGNDTRSDLKIGSLLVLNQFIYVSPTKVFTGNLCFTVLVPVVKISSTDLSGAAPPANPNVFGDIIVGPAIEWSDRKLFGKRFNHRAELDVTAPTGSFDNRYAVNASAHLWTYSAYHAFTIMLNEKVSISSRNQINYNTHIIGTKAKPGAFYNGNYSIDYGVFKNLKIEAAAYYITQLNQDSYDGNGHYYQETYGLVTTKEHVFGYGPGIAYFTPRGVLLEAKAFFEAHAQNRFSGSRPTLRIAIPLSK